MTIRRAARDVPQPREATRVDQRADDHHEEEESARPSSVPGPDEVDVAALEQDQQEVDRVDQQAELAEEPDASGRGAGLLARRRWTVAISHDSHSASSVTTQRDPVADVEEPEVAVVVDELDDRGEGDEVHDPRRRSPR